jgi:SAM-dependent methyltransferase
MSANDSYEEFADRYDLFPRDPAAPEFFRRLFAANQVARVLDCACGTGRDLVMFHALGCEVVGADLSPSMLAKARQNLARDGIQAPLHELDYRQLPDHFEQPFDAVVCLSGALQEASEDTEMLRGLRSMRAVLRAGGLLILTHGMTDKLWRERPRFILDVNDSEVSRVMVIDYFDHGARFNVLDIYHSPERNGLEVWGMDHPRILLGADYERLLGEADFAEVQLFGSFDAEPYDVATSNRLIVVARK